MQIKLNCKILLDYIFHSLNLKISFSDILYRFFNLNYIFCSYISNRQSILAYNQSRLCYYRFLNQFRQQL